MGKKSSDDTTVSQDDTALLAETPSNITVGTLPPAEAPPFQPPANVLPDDPAKGYKGGELFQGMVTGKSVSTATGEDISARFLLPNPVGIDEVFRVFSGYHPSAKRDGFTVDPTNTTDPGLKTHKE